MSQAIEKRAPNVDTMILQARGAFSKALANSLDVEQFAVAGRMVYKTAGKWLLLAINSDPTAFMNSLMQAAQLQLSVDPALGEFYLIPRKHRYPDGKYGWRCEGQIGYIGLMKRARRCPGVVSIDADVVKENDAFAYSKGSRPYLEHSISFGERGEFQGAYAIAYMAGGHPVQVVMNAQEVYAARDRSESANPRGKDKEPSGPWVTDFDAMAKKTPLRRLCKLLAVDDITRAQIHREEQQEALAAPERPAVIDVPRGAVRTEDEAAALLSGRELPASREPGEDDEEPEFTSDMPLPGDPE